jgi:phage tail-like protein
MSLDKEQIKSTYPLPVYNYRVTINGDGQSLVLGFSEISGLTVEYQPVTYRHGLSFIMGTKLIPGMRQPIKFTLKKGVVKGNNFLSSWLYNAYSNPLISPKRDILIDLCDEVGNSVIRWKVQGALPTKLTAPTFDANNNGVAIESLELEAQDLQVDYNPQ